MTGDAFVLMLVVLVGVPLAGVIAGVMGVWALRQKPPRWPFIAVAMLLIATPYGLSILIEPRGGLDMSLKWGAYTVVSPLVFLGLLVGSIRAILKPR